LEQDIQKAREIGLSLVTIRNIPPSTRDVSMGFVVIPSNANIGQRSFGFAIKTRFLGSPNIFFSAQENNNGPANFAAWYTSATRRDLLIPLGTVP
jgi:hypothetical protein